jgi:hypothetical protein
MSVILGRVSLAAALIVGLSGAVAAREGGPAARGADHHRSTMLRGIGFAEPKFGSQLRTSKDQPYTWPVGDRYLPVSQPFYGRAY